MSSRFGNVGKVDTAGEFLASRQNVRKRIEALLAWRSTPSIRYVERVIETKKGHSE